MKFVNVLCVCLVVAGSTGCSWLTKEVPVDRVVYVTTPLPQPVRPDLPTWSGKDMECLAPEVKQKIRDRDTKRREYAEQLEVIIHSTHQ